MEASILDLRYKMNDVLKALERNETVKICYRGKLKGEIRPVKTAQSKVRKIEEQEFFGMNSEDKLSIEQQMQELRKGEIFKP